MVGRIYHVGLTVSDLECSIAFYRDILGLEFQGEIFMEGEETDKMFRKKNCKARVAYLNGSKALEAPPVELIQFIDSKIHKEQSDLFTTSISEVCFYTDDIDSVYRTLIENQVECLSEPQYFDFRADGFGESRARSFHYTYPYIPLTETSPAKTASRLPSSLCTRSSPLSLMPEERAVYSCPGSRTRTCRPTFTSSSL